VNYGTLSIWRPGTWQACAHYLVVNEHGEGWVHSSLLIPLITCKGTFEDSSSKPEILSDAIFNQCGLWKVHSSASQRDSWAISMDSRRTSARYVGGETSEPICYATLSFPSQTDGFALKSPRKY
jgi:hypothetical protein